ncbi:MAG: PKD domain-containing protein [Candidatus Saccharimonadales bacterium]
MQTIRAKLASNPFLLGFVLAVLASIAFVAISTGTAHAADCSNNSIIQCGVSDRTDFVNKVNQNATGDLQNIYADYGLVPSEYARFAAEAREGMSYRDGRIVVDGRTVATSTKSIGRTKFSYSQAKNIAGTTYWESNTTQVQKKDLPVLVLFNERGEFEFAVLKDCANPINGNANNPQFGCNSLRTLKHDRNTFSFSTDAGAGGGASIAKVVYDFGDGTTVERSNPNEVVTHSYAKPGSYHVTTTVYISLPGGKTYTIAASGECTHSVVVDEPIVYACSVLQAKTLNETKTEFRFTPQYTAKGATLTSVMFTLDNGKGEVVKPKNGEVYKDYSFSDENKHTVVATLMFNVGGSEKTIKCSASVIPTQPPKCPVPGKEQYAPDAPECFTPCPVNPALPISSINCVSPPPTTTLPSTGPGDIALMFAALVGFGAGAHYIMKRRSQRIQGLAHAAANDDPTVLMSFIAKNNPSQEETLLAEQEFLREHPLPQEASHRTSHHRLVQKAAPHRGNYRNHS